ADLDGPARGLAYQLVQGLGAVSVRDARDQLGALAPDARYRLTSLGIQFGNRAVYLGALTKRGPMATRAILWQAHAGHMIDLPAEPKAVTAQPELDARDYMALGYTAAGPLAVPTNKLERFLARTTRAIRNGDTGVGLDDIAELFGDDRESILPALKSCGLTAKIGDDAIVLSPARANRRGPKKIHPSPSKSGAKSGRQRERTRDEKIDPQNPFAKLRHLQTAR
ncbi:MAG: hypothetical protein O7A03_10105, partial [Alphaproteobacteria bacterium]|nr:hypothetical protein [Alphaproteobacteria bacterium]